MPSPRKRIGFLPRPIVQELIREIAKEEKLSQSRVVGILVEEALLARGIIAPHISNDIKRNSSFEINHKVNSESYLYNDMNELISDKGVTYNKSIMNRKKGRKTNNLSMVDEKINAELFMKFKKFLEFQKYLESEKTKL